MNIKLLLFFQFVMVNIVFSQTIEHPVVFEKSHPTLSIIRIEKGEKETVFHISIVNLLNEGGWFCIDNSVKLNLTETGQEIKMLKSDGLPICPQTHNFTGIGEEINFRLYFPNLPDKITELDLIEDCDDNCFYFRGVVMDHILNNEIRTFENGLAHYSKQELDAALESFIMVRDNSKFRDRKHFGYSIFIIPVIYHNSGNLEAAKTAYKKLLDTEFGDKDYFITQLQKIDYFKNLSF